MAIRRPFFGNLLLVILALFLVSSWAQALEILVPRLVEPCESAYGWRTQGANSGPLTAISTSPKVKKSGNSAWELTYDFLGGGNPINNCTYLNIGKSSLIPGTVQALKFWLYGDGSGHRLVFRLRDNSGQILQYNGGYITWVGWKEVTLDLDKNLQTYWAGSNSGKPSFPVYLFAVLIESKSATFKGSGKIYLDDIYALTPVTEESSMECSAITKLGNIFTSNEKVALTIEFNNLWNKERILDVTYEIGSTHQRRVTSGSFTIKTPPGKTSRQISVPIDANGTYLMTLFARSQDGVIRIKKEIPFSRVIALEPEGEPTPIKIGVQTHLAHGQGFLHETMELVQKGGFGLVRDEMYWGEAEPKKGEVKTFYDWDRRLEEASKKGIGHLIGLTFGNNLYDQGGPPYTEEGIAAYARYAATLAEKYKGQITYFEVWNEYNNPGGFNKTNRPPEDYARMLEAVYKAVKAVNPDAVILGGATVWVDLPWFERVLKAGGHPYMDAVSIHPYSVPVSPEEGKLVEKLQQLNALFEQYGGSKPIYITEVGWPTHDGARGISELMAASYGIRTAVLSISTGMVPYMSWYNLENKYETRYFGGKEASKKHSEDNFGLVRTTLGDEEVPLAAKDNFVAFTALNQMLAGAQFNKAYEAHDPIRLYHFNRNRKQDFLVLWSLKGPQTIGLKVGIDSVRFVDVFGNSYNLKTQNGIVALTVTEIPFYLEGDFDSVEIVAAPIVISGDYWKVWAGETLEIDLSVHQQIPTGKMLLDLPSGWRLLGDSDLCEGKQKLVIQLPKQATAQKYELVLYPYFNNNIQGRLVVETEVVDSAILNVAPHFQLNDDGTVDSKLAINIKNSTAGQTLSGTLNIINPTVKNQNLVFNEIGPGEEQTLFVKLDQEQNLVIPVNVSARLNTGQLYSVEKTVAFLGANRVTAGSNPFAETQSTIHFQLNKADQIRMMTDWGGPDDLSAKGFFSWDRDNLYLTVLARDNVHYQTENSDRIWLGDSIQFALDPGWAGGPGSMGYHEFGLAMDNQGTTTVWRWIAPGGWNVGKVEGAKCNISRSGALTRYELTLPWQEIAPASLRIEKGFSLGFSLLINDNDGYGRRGWLEYMGGIGAQKDAKAFGDLVLFE